MHVCVCVCLHLKHTLLTFKECVCVCACDILNNLQHVGCSVLLWLLLSNEFAPWTKPLNGEHLEARN